MKRCTVERLTFTR